MYGDKPTNQGFYFNFVVSRIGWFFSQNIAKLVKLYLKINVGFFIYNFVTLKLWQFFSKKISKISQIYTRKTIFSQVFGQKSDKICWKFFYECSYIFCYFQSFVKIFLFVEDLTLYV
jgi:hypothetical protein